MELSAFGTTPDRNNVELARVPTEGRLKQSRQYEKSPKPQRNAEPPPSDRKKRLLPEYHAKRLMRKRIAVKSGKKAYGMDRIR